MHFLRLGIIYNIPNGALALLFPKVAIFNFHNSSARISFDENSGNLSPLIQKLPRLENAVLYKIDRIYFGSHHFGLQMQGDIFDSGITAY